MTKAQQQHDRRAWRARARALGVDPDERQLVASRDRLAALPEITDEMHAENLRWLDELGR
jgi:hypothetical protein